ncbi:MAG: phosphoenolpyruvate synthase [Bacteroidetes bacterium]|nr:phosphoenolpyruvate synthase [Bacteroidota bacterium]MBU1720255.1 phosphoenolpyruvate synthase [Bacteroidota bacterium]
MAIPNTDSLRYYFSDVSFSNLMKRRIYHVLLICSSYDAFMLEEDGLIEEQVFNEYIKLNLRYPPQFIQVSSAEEAFAMMEEQHVDLIINTLGVSDMDPFELSQRIKSRYPNKPIVVLTPFSREVSQKLLVSDTNSVDHIFCWLGNADILLVIIKLIEDRMNAEYDIQEVGVQAILLVEDSIRYYSSYLPIIYKIIFNQSLEFMTEGLNEHQKMLRMRGRPKILLATSYEEALQLYVKFKNNLLGIISDVSFSRNGVKDPFAGVRLCEKVKADDKFMPLLLQSSDKEKELIAKKNKVGFIHKYSKTLLHEIKDFITEYFAFGDFIFVNPETHEEINRARDLRELQQKIWAVPDESIEYHIERNHFSKWLKARALFPIADIFINITRQDFPDMDTMRKFMFETIAAFRYSKGRGIIAEFYRERFDEYLLFTRNGKGSLGGKARGLAFIDSIIKRHKLYDKFKDVIITIPRTVVLCSDVFDEFMTTNNLYSIALSDRSDVEILQHFLQARLPIRIHEDLYAFLRFTRNPIAVRSSSLLEDSHYQPFAGVYSTYMVPRLVGYDPGMIEQISNAIKCVYASVYFKNSKSYMAATSHVIDEEKMSVVLQEVCGKRYGNRLYPNISGVARSINFYPIAPEKSEDGIANVALGLGKYIVDGGSSLRFSPKYPKKILQLSSPESALRDTQKIFYALDLTKGSFTPSVDDGANLLKMKISNAEEDGTLRHLASTFDMQNNIIRDGLNYEGKRLITFSNILNFNTFPLADILSTLLEIGQKEMSNPIEIEFACQLDVPDGQPRLFNFLQIRPIVDNKQTMTISLDTVKQEDAIIISNSALGNGEIDNLNDIIYVRLENFNKMENPNIALRLERLNDEFVKSGRYFILIGPGRWGSSEPTLGIPVKWTQISCARVIIESGLDNFRIDPSQGSHFFHNLTSFRVGYITINPFMDDGYFDIEYLNSRKAVYEDEYVRHVRFRKPVMVKIDGKKNKAVIFKEEMSEKSEVL